MQEEVIRTKKKKPHIIHITIAALAISQVLTVFRVREIRQEMQEALSKFQKEWVQWMEDRNRDLEVQGQLLDELLDYFEAYRK